MNAMETLRDTEFDTARTRLGQLINLPAPASPAVTRRALSDEKFATYLMLTKDSPELQKQLLDDPRNDGYMQDAPVATEQSPIATPTVEHSAGELLSRASTAFIKWSGTGFRQADEATRERRWAACQSCEYLADPPESLLYQGLRLLVGKETKICAACGCVANKKVGIPTEHCPVQRADGSGLSIWGEPWVKPKRG